MMMNEQDFDPIRILEVELSKPLPTIATTLARNGKPYGRATVLVRLHRQPLGWLDLHLLNHDLPASEYAQQIWGSFQQPINQHLEADGLAPVSELTQSGLPTVPDAACIREHNQQRSKAPLVSVIVATRNRPASISACIRSLLAMDYPNFEIVVVDNAPNSNATAEAVLQAYPHGSQVRYVREDRAGLSWARNQGVLAARAEIVAFTDDDVLVDRHWLTELVQGFSAAQDVGCVTGMILPAELETPAQMWLEQYGGFNKGFDQQIYDLAEHRRPEPLYPYTAGLFGSGANMAFKKAVLRAIDGFDPALGSGSLACGGEDLAAFFQVITQGYTLVYQPTALLYHPHHRDYARLQQQMFGYGAGLTAFLTKCLSDDPRRLVDFAGNLFHGLAYVFSPSSRKNRKKRNDYPRQLTRIELRGMAYGPLGYWRSRLKVRAMLKAAGESSVSSETIAYREKVT